MPAHQLLVVIAFAVASLVGAPLFAAKPVDPLATLPTDSPPARQPEFASRVDALLEQQWTAAGVEPAPAADDSEFLRRAYLDFAGVIPRVSEVRAFLADERPDKRERLIDELLASPRYSTHMATTWRNRIVPQGVDPARNREAIALQKWLRSRFAKNLRYDNLVGELLVTLGGDELGPALYYQANDLSPEKLAGSAAELFLGVKLHCAQCHDHPFAEWSQHDFWGLAAFFAQVQAREDRRMAMSMAGPLRLVDADEGDVRLPDSNEIVPPRFPRGDAAADDGRRPRRAQLALWMTDRENRFFSRAAVNWAWSHLFGRGLVDSLDDIEEAAPSPNTQLLNELADHFSKSGYDLRELWRTLANTRAYQLSSRHENPDSTPAELFARMLPKPLTPEQQYDSFLILAPPAAAKANVAASAMANSLDEDPQRIAFVRQMRFPSSDRTEYGAGTLQVLMLMNGPVAAGVSAPDTSSILGALDAPFMKDEGRVESLFLATLARRPSPEELDICVRALRASTEPDYQKRALSDILWAQLNSTEFAFNH